MKLFPYRFKFAGLFLIAVGLILSYANLLKHFEFKSLNISVFSIFSWFSEPKFFTVFSSNLTNEIAITMVLSGLLFLVFSKEKNETAGMMEVRFKAMFAASVIHMIYLFLITFFTYGLAYIIMITSGTVLIFLFYLVIFKIMLVKFRLIDSK